MSEDLIIGRGLAFPLRPSRSGLVREGGEDKVRDSIWLILGTAPGERLMRPDFGCTIHDLLFEANTPELRGLIAVRVREALVSWEPRIDVLAVRADPAAGRRSLVVVQIDYRLRVNNALGNVVYPLFLDEGAPS